MTPKSEGDIQAEDVRDEFVDDIKHELDDESKPKPVQWQYKHGNIAYMVVLHTAALYGLYLAFTSAKWATLVFAWFFYWFTGFGGTAGAHRYWTHRSFKATIQLRILMMIFNSACYIGSIFDWARDHRIHHKYSETDKDPHNAKRGFFFSHMGWLMVKKTPEVLEAGNTMDLSDLVADPVVRFQKKYYYQMAIFFCFIVPTIIPVFLWNESVPNALFVPGFLRWVIQLHAIFFVNSLAHLVGRRPYDTRINPAENAFVSAVVGGEGFHNYHHTFPWDYATSELGWLFNPSKTFIDVMALIGWAYDLKTATPAMIKARKQRTGDYKINGPYGKYN